MTTNTIISQKEAREKILTGVLSVAEAVTSTLGPGGRNVIIEQPSYMPPIVTKDGVSVAKSIRLEDNFQNMGAQMVIEVASKTNTTCGDGTTTATLLASEMYKRAVEAVDKHNISPMVVKRLMLQSLETAKSLVSECIVRVDDDESIKNVACISANGDTEIGEMVASIIKETGKDGIVVVQEGNNLTTTWSTTKGVRLDSGFISPYFANKEDGSATFENAYVLFYAKKITNIQEIFPAISQANRANRPLVIIAEDFENDVMSTLVVNRMRGTFNGCAVKAPGVLHQMKVDFITDAAYATGGTVICDDLGIKLEDVTEKEFGKAKRIDVTAFTTTFVEGSADDELFNQRVNELRAELTKDEVNDYRRGVLRERLAKLVAGIGVVKVGGETRSIIKEKRDRIDDAICATREAIDGGIVAGAGSTLYKVGLTMLDNAKTVGDSIIGNALMMPLNKILSNAGVIDSELHKTLVSNYTNDHSMQNLHGVDARTLTLTTDLIKSGIIDPANVTLNAMTNAASVSALLIATDCMIGINPDKTPRIAMEHIDG